MKASSALLLVVILGMVLMAPPAYPQKVDEKVLLQNLSVDMINLKNTLKQMQDASDHKNAEMLKAIQDMTREVSTRFGSMDTNIQKLNESLTGIKTSDDKSQRDIQEARTSLEALRKIVDEGFNGLTLKTNSLTRQLNDMKSAEQPLPGAGQVFQQAYGELDSGFPDLAISDFREFLKTYPNDLRSPAAQYYIGDALMAQKKFQEAADEFDLVLTKYPTSDKKCSALYQKGRAFIGLKQIPQAQTVLQTVSKECAGTQEAANATQDLKTLPKPQRGN